MAGNPTQYPNTWPLPRLRVAVERPQAYPLGSWNRPIYNDTRTDCWKSSGSCPQLNPPPRPGYPPRGWASDPIDQANANAEAELQIRLHQTDGPLLRAIEEALSRLRRGAYGVCETCKQPISKARLEAVPWTRHCRECKEGEHPAA